MKGHNLSTSGFFRWRTLLAFAFLAVIAGSATAQTSSSCFPTCSTTDARFLMLAGVGTGTLGGNDIQLGIELSAGTTTLNLDIFDGDTGGMWDKVGTINGVPSVVPVNFSIYADPEGDGASTDTNGNPILVTSTTGAMMNDNAWSTISIATDARALTAVGTYRYYVIAELTDPTVKGTNSNFKVRVNGGLSLSAGEFAFSAPYYGTAERAVLYPSYPAFLPTTYDGTWEFYLNADGLAEHIDVWDGDMDFGSIDGVDQDTDDKNTSAGNSGTGSSNGIPKWAVGTEAVPQGRALGIAKIWGRTGNAPSDYVTGNPCDNNLNPLYMRGKSVTYHLIDPNGNKYHNGNPSGNLEWEMFRVGVVAADTATYDHLASALPWGVYTVHIDGMDLGNVNFWRSSMESMGVDATGTPVKMIAVPPSCSMRKNYWLRHPQNWPLTTLTIGHEEYDQDEMMEVLRRGGNDHSTKLAAEYICAALNVANGEIAWCADEAMNNAEKWLKKYPVGSQIKASNAVWNEIVQSYKLLLEYNKGHLCATCKDLKKDGCAQDREFWKKNPTVWPLSSVTIYKTTYTKTQTLEMLARGGSNTADLAREIIAAKLNIANGSSTVCLGTALADAEKWLGNTPIGTKASKGSWKGVEAAFKWLRQYNDGKFCKSCPNTNSSYGNIK